MYLTGPICAGNCTFTSNGSSYCILNYYSIYAKFTSTILYIHPQFLLWQSWLKLGERSLKKLQCWHTSARKTTLYNFFTNTDRAGRKARVVSVVRLYRDEKLAFTLRQQGLLFVCVCFFKWHYWRWILHFLPFDWNSTDTANLQTSESGPAVMSTSSVCLHFPDTNTKKKSSQNTQQNMFWNIMCCQCENNVKQV